MADDTNQTTALPGGSHDPETGKAALIFVRNAVSDLRPDLGATVLTAALAELAMTLPPDRRSQYARAVRNMLTACFAKVDVL